MWHTHTHEPSLKNIQVCPSLSFIFVGFASCFEWFSRGGKTLLKTRIILPSTHSSSRSSSIEPFLPTHHAAALVQDYIATLTTVRQCLFWRQFYRSSTSTTTIFYDPFYSNDDLSLWPTFTDSSVASCSVAIKVSRRQSTFPVWLKRPSLVWMSSSSATLLDDSFHAPNFGQLVTLDLSIFLELRIFHFYLYHENDDHDTSIFSLTHFPQYSTMFNCILSPYFGSTFFNSVE